MHLFSKENIWSNPHASSIHPVIQTSTIILWTELFPKKRREKIQGEILQSIFEYSGVSTFLQELQDSNFEYSVFYSVPHAIQQLQDILHTELILLQEFSKKYYNYKAHPVQINTRHLPATVPRVSKHSTRQNKAPGSLQYSRPTAQAGFQLILPGRNSILSGSQHPRSPYSSSQAHSYRILPGEIGFFPKGLSIVCPCNTKVSVFQFTYSCA